MRDLHGSATGFAFGTRRDKKKQRARSAADGDAVDAAAGQRLGRTARRAAVAVVDDEVAEQVRRRIAVVRAGGAIFGTVFGARRRQTPKDAEGYLEDAPRPRDPFPDAAPPDPTPAPPGVRRRRAPKGRRKKK